MRFICLACLGLLLSQATYPAIAAKSAVTMRGVARAASLMQAIGDVCGPTGADIALSAKFYKAFADAGREAYGQMFDKVLEQELARRATETHAIGVVAWCAQQKQQQDKLGNQRLFAPER